MRDWNDVLPEPITMAQAAWERRRSIDRCYHVSGLTRAQIAQRFNIGKPRLYQIIKEVAAERRRAELSPIELYFLRDRDVRQIHLKIQRKIRADTKRLRAKLKFLSSAGCEPAICSWGEVRIRL